MERKFRNTSALYIYGLINILSACITDKTLLPRVQWDVTEIKRTNTHSFVEFFNICILVAERHTILTHHADHVFIQQRTKRSLVNCSNCPWRLLAAKRLISVRRDPSLLWHSDYGSSSWMSTQRTRPVHVHQFEQRVIGCEQIIANISFNGNRKLNGKWWSPSIMHYIITGTIQKWTAVLHNCRRQNSALFF